MATGSETVKEIVLKAAAITNRSPLLWIHISNNIYFLQFSSAPIFDDAAGSASQTASEQNISLCLGPEESVWAEVPL